MRSTPAGPQATASSSAPTVVIGSRSRGIADAPQRVGDQGQPRDSERRHRAREGIFAGQSCARSSPAVLTLLARGFPPAAAQDPIATPTPSASPAPTATATPSPAPVAVDGKVVARRQGRLHGQADGPDRRARPEGRGPRPPASPPSPASRSRSSSRRASGRSSSAASRSPRTGASPLKLRLQALRQPRRPRGPRGQPADEARGRQGGPHPLLLALAALRLQGPAACGSSSASWTSSATASAARGVYDSATGRAVMAYRKVNSHGPHGERRRAGIVRDVLAGKGGYKVRYPKMGHHVEADISQADPRARRRRQARQRLPHVLGRAGDADRARHLPLLLADASGPTPRAWSTPTTSSAGTRSTATRPCRRTTPATAACGCRSRTPTRSSTWINLGDQIRVDA